MSRNTEHLRPFVRSFRNEKQLARKRDANALFLKYSTPPLERVEFLLGFADPDDSDDEVYSFGNMAVELNGKSPIFGFDPKHNIIIGLDEPVNGMHIFGFQGLKNLRTELAKAAEVLRGRSQNHDYVQGVTYAALANVAVRMGFGRMDILCGHPTYLDDVLARERAFCVVNGRDPQTAGGPAALYLPTNEFVEKFA